jgi:hypothetical protein
MCAEKCFSRLGKEWTKLSSKACVRFKLKKKAKKKENGRIEWDGGEARIEVKKSLENEWVFGVKHVGYEVRKRQESATRWMANKK